MGGTRSSERVREVDVDARIKRVHLSWRKSSPGEIVEVSEPRGHIRLRLSKEGRTEVGMDA
jgi:hypothetical protein